MNLWLGIFNYKFVNSKTNCIYYKFLSLHMDFRVLVLFLPFLLFILNNEGIYAENTESTLENSSPIKEQRSTPISRIHPILSQWQLSDNPNKFAKENNLSYTENKIGVYIYLDSADSLSQIPPEIIVTANNEKIVSAFVSSEQLDKLGDMDFI